jgi:hypothetical protein
LADSNKDHSKKLDEFWDIGRLIPAQKRSSPIVKVPTKRIEKVEIPASNPTHSPKAEKITVKPIKSETPPQAVTKTVDKSYEDLSFFIKNVKVINWTSTYNYYELFCRQAMELYNKKGSECAEVHFFSYVAQYSQLNRSQLAWYLWWRECVRNGKFLKTDISYIYLLVFEIINLGNSIDTKESLNILISLWSHYKDMYPQLKSSLGDWICDYSLIHKLSIPFPDPRIKWDMISSCTMPEIFFQFDISNRNLLAKFLLAFCSSYQYRKSKFYIDDNQAIYDQYLLLALQHILEHFDIIVPFLDQTTKHTSRVSYTGALCSYKTRKHIEIDYVSLGDSHELKAWIGDIVKYAENKLRAYLGIRSRLGIHNLRSDFKEWLDEFFAEKLSVANGERIPEYERFYEAPKNVFSLSAALDIEEHSWEITQKLVEAFEDETVPLQLEKEPETPVVDNIIEESSEIEQFFNEISQHLQFFELVAQQDFTGQQAYLQKKCLMAEAVVDQINEVAVDIFGDILIEEAGDGFVLIEEYKSMFLQGEFDNAGK